MLKLLAYTQVLMFLTFVCQVNEVDEINGIMQVDDLIKVE